MTLDQINAKLAELVKLNGIGLKKSIQLDFGQGEGVYIKGAQAVNEIKDADCTIKLTRETLTKISEKRLDPVMAFMGRKVGVTGDYSGLEEIQTLMN